VLWIYHKWKRALAEHTKAVCAPVVDGLNSNQNDNFSKENKNNQSFLTQNPTPRPEKPGF
jgi:hypothetical protein